MNLEVFSERRRVSVGLVAPSHSAVVRLVRRVDVHVLLAVGRVGEPTVAALDLALERFLAYKQKQQQVSNMSEDIILRWAEFCHIPGSWTNYPVINTPATCDTLYVT